jgi:hypothetical protein
MPRTSNKRVKPVITRSRKAKPVPRGWKTDTPVDLVVSTKVQEQAARIAELEQMRVELVEMLGLSQRGNVENWAQIEKLKEQGDYLRAVVNTLLDRLIGTQLTAGMTTADAAIAFVHSERFAFDQQLKAIDAKHEPQSQAGESQ